MPGRDTRFTKALRVPVAVGEAIGHKPAKVVQPIVCPDCTRSLPPSEFRRLPGDRRCESCVKKWEEHSRAPYEADDVKRVAAQLLDAASKGTTAPTLDDMIGELMDQFGGYRTFVMEWVLQLKTAFDARPGAVSNLQACAAIAKLVGLSDRNKNDIEIAKMSDDQINKTLELEMMRMLSERTDDETRKKFIAMLAMKQGADVNALIPVAKDAEGGSDGQE